MERKAQFDDAKREFRVARLLNELEPTEENWKRLKRAEAQLSDLADSVVRGRGARPGYQTAAF